MRIALILSLSAAFAMVCCAQTAAFDAVSIRPAASDAGGRSFTQRPGGGLSTSNATVRMLLAFAYQVMPEEISGGPEWAGSDGFDIQAKAGNPNVSPAQFREMIQSLLADRFHLRLHRETRELAVYVLMQAKGGTKLVKAKDGTAEPPGVRIQGGGLMTGTHATMAGLANVLIRPLKRRVFDETGLQGTYDFELRYAPDPVGADDAAASDSPSIFTALEEQLGLSLKTAKRPVEVIALDSVEKPGPD